MPAVYREVRRSSWTLRDRYTRLHLVFTRELHRVGQAHRELLDACKTRNPDVAAAALWKHITEAGEYLKEFIQRHREQHS